jgi:hypothetical protein
MVLADQIQMRNQNRRYSDDDALGCSTDED